jgi:hypothetical protein
MKYYECVCACVCVASAIQRAKRMRRTVLSCDLFDFSIFFSSHKRLDFRRYEIEREMCVLIFSTFAWTICHFRRIQRDTKINIHRCSWKVSIIYYCRILIKHEGYWQIYRKFSNIKFNENPSNGSGVVPRGRLDGRTDGQTTGWS